MSSRSSTDKVTAGRFLLRLSIPLLINAAIIGGAAFVILRMLGNSPATNVNERPTEISYTEAEWIPHAVMGSLLPGRFVFEPGDGELVVISRVHERRPLDAGEIDRLWMQLPANVEVGKSVDLSDLQAAQHLGFDRGIYGEGVFAQFPKVSGTVTLRQRHARWLVVELVGSVTPPQGPAWPLEDLFVAYLEPSGRHAGRAGENREAASVIPFASMPAAVNPVGRWRGEIINDKGESEWDLYFQFNADGTCAHATCRGGGGGTGYSPGMKFGTWRLQGDRLTIHTEVFIFDEPTNNDHLFHLQGQPLLILSAAVKDNGMTLEGDFRAPIMESTSPILFRQSVSMPDLFTHRPNFNRKPGYYERAAPTPGQVVPRGRVR